jgi:hypothetical protein
VKSDSAKENMVSKVIELLIVHTAKRTELVPEGPRRAWPRAAAEARRPDGINSQPSARQSRAA